MARALIAVTGGATDTELVPAVAGKSIHVLAFHFTVASAAATVSLTDGADGATTRLATGTFAVGGGLYDRTDDPDKPIFVTTAGNALNITNSAGNLRGSVTYRYNPV